MHPPRLQLFAFLREFSALCVVSRGERSSRWNSPPRGHPRPEPQFVAQRSTPIDFARPRSPPLLLHLQVGAGATSSWWRAPGKGTKREVRREVRRGARMPCVGARCARARCLSLARGTAALPHSTNAHHHELRMCNTPCTPTDLHEQWRPSARRRRPKEEAKRQSLRSAACARAISLPVTIVAN